MNENEIDKLYEKLKAYIDNYNSRQKPEDVLKIKKKLGNGAFGFVVEVSYHSRNLAGKLIKKEINDETDLIREFKGRNIIKTTLIINNINFENDDEEKTENYNFILMELAPLKDLYYLIQELYEKNKLKLIVKPPFEGEVSDNLIRFFAHEIVKGLESLDRQNYSHFDIKPDNLLLVQGLIPKLSDFSLLRSPNKIEKKDGKVKIPGGTPGFLTPEYYQEDYVSPEIAKTQDYFAFGATLFKLKYGISLIPGKRYPGDETTTDYLIDLIQRGIDLIRSKKLSDKDFNDFLISLIKYKPEERANFEEIYRNKWLNKNLEDISKCYKINSYDEDKLFMELNKSDFLNEKKNKLNKNRKKFIFND